VVARVSVRRLRCPEGRKGCQSSTGVDSRLIRWIVEAGRRAMSIQSVNPATGETLETFEETSRRSSSEASRPRPRPSTSGAASPSPRGADDARGGRVCAARAGDYARTMTLEMGKRIVQAEAEIDKCAVGVRVLTRPCEACWRRSRARRTRRAATSASTARTRARRHALELSLLAVFRFAAPALMAATPGSSSTPRTFRAPRSPSRTSSGRRASRAACSPPCWSQRGGAAAIADPASSR